MVKTNRKFYAAYGIDINVNQMRCRCPEAYPFGWGVIEDYELEFRGLANIKKSRGKTVPVVLWNITEEDEMGLDSFEDLSLYRKEIINIKLLEVNDLVAPFSAGYYKDGIDAIVYTMDVGNLNPERAPSLEYYKKILQGYKQNNIDPEPLAKATILADGKLL